MLLHRREDAEVALDAPVVVVTDIIFNHIDQLFLRGKALAVVPFTLQDAPKALHGTVVNALGHAGHALRHTGLLQLVMEGTVGVLKTSVTMKERMRIGIGLYGSVEGLEYQWIVIPVAYHISDNATVIEVEDRAEINLVYLDALIPFELCYIGQPFFVRLVRMEVAVKKIFSNILRILCPPCTAMVIVLDGGLDALGPTDAKNALVVHMNVMIMAEIVIDAAVALIRALHVDLLDLLRKLLVLHSPGALFPGRPAKVGGSRNVQQLTGRLNRIAFLCMAFLNSAIQMGLPYLREASLLSISSNFFSRSRSISAIYNLCLRRSISI